MSRLRRSRRLAAARLYLCVDRRAARGDLEQLLDAACGAGVDVIQLRDKEATRDELVQASEVFRAVARRHDTLFVINDDPALAVEVGADGVHVGQDDSPPSEARLVVGPDLVVGQSTHDAEQIGRALTEHCDYFTIGPVHATPTKQGRPGIGLDPVRHAAETAGDRPWFVSGAMSSVTAPDVVAAGARALVVVRAITTAADPAAAVRELRAFL